MARIKPMAQRDLSRSDVRAALRNLVERGLVVARTNVDGKAVYFCPEFAPPLGPFKLESHQRKVDPEDGRSQSPPVRPRRRR
jgi:hypothetical protein